jgi:hypothetical protein
MRLTLTGLHWKWNRLLLDRTWLVCWRPNNIETRVTGKTGFDKIIILFFGLQRANRYFPIDATYATLFENAFIYYILRLHNSFIAQLYHTFLFLLHVSAWWGHLPVCLAFMYEYNWWNEKLAGQIKVITEYPPHWHLVNHKHNMTCLASDPDRLGRKLPFVSRLVTMSLWFCTTLLIIPYNVMFEYNSLFCFQITLFKLTTDYICAWSVLLGILVQAGIWNVRIYFDVELVSFDT